MKSFYLNVGSRIKNRRKKLNMSREELAEKLAVSSNFLYSIERGTKGFSVDTLIKLSKALGVSNEYLLCGNNNSQNEDILNLFNSFPENQREEILGIIKSIYKISLD